MSHLYLDESLDLAGLAPGAVVELSGDEARHAVTVSRIRAGERIAIGDGRGIVVHGVVTSTGPRELALEADDIVIEAPAATAHHARPGAREGRPRRAGGAGGHRARRRRDRAVGGRALRLALGGRRRPRRAASAGRRSCARP